MTERNKSTAIVLLSLACVVFLGVIVYQRLVIDAQHSVILEMYQFIRAGCPFSELH